MKEMISKIGLTSFQLKLIGMITMIIDHIGVVFFPQYSIFRIIGRIAFPIFCFLIVEGFFHTRDIKKYMMRMLFMALLSEAPYDLLFYGKGIELDSQNVFFTLLLGILLLYLLEILPGSFAKISSIILIMLVSEAMKTDYSASGILLILCFYVFYGRPFMRNMSAIVVNGAAMGGVQAYAIAALIPISFYKGALGRKGQRYFYAVYPVSLLILLLLRILI